MSAFSRWSVERPLTARESLGEACEVGLANTGPVLDNADGEMHMASE